MASFVPVGCTSLNGQKSIRSWYPASLVTSATVLGVPAIAAEDLRSQEQPPGCRGLAYLANLVGFLLSLMGSSSRCTFSPFTFSGSADVARSRAD